MPELPEVEVIRRGLHPLVRGRTVTGAAFGNKRLRLPVPRAAIRDRVVGRAIHGCGRRAKYLLLELAGGVFLVVHLGMSGRFFLAPAGGPRERHLHLRLALDDGHELRFVDPRRFGSLQVAPDAHSLAALFENYGPEPLAPGFHGGVLAATAGHRRQPIKNILLDGRVVAGIGNIYAAESLFVAGIHPLQPAADLTPAAWDRLAAALRRVLAAAIQAGGTTISDFADAGGRPGYFQNQLLVYGRQGLPCPRCATPIQRLVLAGRATCFCPRCQPLA